MKFQYPVGDNYVQRSTVHVDIRSSYLCQAFYNAADDNEVSLTESGQVRLYRATVVSRLLHYVSEHPPDLNRYLTPLTYAYNVQVHRSAKLILSSLVLSWYPPAPASPKTTTIPPDINNIDSLLTVRISLMNCALLIQQPLKNI